MCVAVTEHDTELFMYIQVLVKVISKSSIAIHIDSGVGVNGQWKS